LRSEKARHAFLRGLTAREARAALAHWPSWARPEQLPPEGDWTTWLFLGGRGAGKTRAGAEWVRALATGPNPPERIALVAETHQDARETMVEGHSGLLAVHPKGERPRCQPSRRRLEWPNGVVAQWFSSEDPEGLRGPQFGAAWADELAKWRHADATWDMLQFGLRLGARPRQVVTTTPRPTTLLKRLLAEDGTVVTRAATAANAAHLPEAFLNAIIARFEGTALGRQELDGDLVEDTEGALWSRAAIDQGRVRAAPELTRLVVALDPAVTSNETSDACGIVVAGRGVDGRAYVVRDATLRGAPPDAWAARAIALWRELEADAIVAEVNQGGDLVTGLISALDAEVPVRGVRASRGKVTRAEPVAALYAQGRVSHVGTFAELEDEMCAFTPTMKGAKSPDRVDALVWAITALDMIAAPRPRIRGV
jgi:predicted phage terminase large subunit-like protein